jgi:hypothetical protein
MPGSSGMVAFTVSMNSCETTSGGKSGSGK